MKKVILLGCLLLIQAVGIAATTFEVGRDSFYDKDYERARYYLTKELRKNPDNYQAYYMLGLSYKYLNDKQNAIISLKKVLTLAPKYDLTYQYAKTELLNLENPERAVKAYKQDLLAQQAENKKDNYYDYMSLGHKSYIWKEFPVKVYIEPYEHTAWVKRSFVNWERATGFVSFDFVSEPEMADIVVATTQKGIPAANGGQLLGVTKWNYTQNGYMHSAKITILKRRPEDMSRYPKEHFVSVLQHEIGHALGLGHSSTCDDIMGTGCSSDEIGERAISERDIKTLEIIYGLNK